MGDEDGLENLLRGWLGGELQAGGAWLDRKLPPNLDYGLVGQAIDSPRDVDVVKLRERAQRTLWKNYLREITADDFTRLQARDGFRTALAQGVDSDAALLRRWAADNQSAGVRLHRRHHASLLRFIRGMVHDDPAAEDLASETFADLVKQRSSIRGFKPMMYAIARNKVCGWFGQQMKRPVNVEEDGISQIPEPTTEQPEARAAKRASLKLLLRALHSLPLNQQMVMVLYRWEDLSAREIGEVFGWDEPNVRGKLRLGVERLRKFLENPPPAADGTPSDTTELMEWFHSLHDKTLAFADRAGAPA